MQFQFLFVCPLLQSSFKPTKLPQYFRTKVCLLEVSCLTATSHKTSDIHSVYLAEFRATHSLSQTLDGSFRSRACKLIASCCHVQASAVQGFIPKKQPSFLSKGFAPVPLHTLHKPTCVGHFVHDRLRGVAPLPSPAFPIGGETNRNAVPLFRFQAPPGYTRVRLVRGVFRKQHSQR
jgi:hypothetical protein